MNAQSLEGTSFDIATETEAIALARMEGQAAPMLEQLQTEAVIHGLKASLDSLIQEQTDARFRIAFLRRLQGDVQRSMRALILAAEAQRQEALLIDIQKPQDRKYTDELEAQHHQLVHYLDLIEEELLALEDQQRNLDACQQQLDVLLPTLPLQ